MTTALMAMFAACTNDDFISDEQGIQSEDATMRPTVEATLNVLGDGEGADTRLYFDGNRYQWQVGDTIGALLMDKVIANNGTKDIRPHDDIEAWEDLAWTSRYELVDYINTNYPFVRQTSGEWTTNAKMLEGNYFFAFPFASYSGNREAIHSLGEQVQNGSSMAAVQEAYAKNQFFIGYSRIHAGTEGGDVMNASLDMTSVLGPVYVQLQNTGNKPFTVEKIVLESNSFSTLIKINPTNALYDGEDATDDTQGKYNLNGGNANPKWTITDKATYFNYANYEEDYANDFKERFASADDINVLDELVNNTKKSTNYNRQEALRAVIKGVEGADHRAELAVVGAEPLYGDVSASETQTYVVMANGDYKYNGKDGADGNPVMLTIYTDRGMVGPVNISNINAEVNNSDGNNDGKKDVTVISQNAITEIYPGNGKNIVTLQIDDNSVQEPWNMDVYNNDDLLKFIEWNKAATTLRVFTAKLQNDVTLTKEMTDLLTNMNAKLLVNTNDKKLTIAEDAASNILDYVMVDKGTGTDAATIVVNNALTLGSKSYVNGTFKTGLSNIEEKTLNNTLKVAEGGKVTVATPITYETTGDYREQTLKIVENEGTVDINAAVEKLTIAENKATVDINANVTFEGKNANSNKNLENATITIAKGATVNAAGKLTNAGVNYYEDRDAAEYAVINNNGRINNLVNGNWGKVVASKGSITHADENDGKGSVIEIATLDTEWNVQGDTKGIVSYTAKDEVALLDVIESKITELVVDGGSVKATTIVAGTAEPAANYSDASTVKTIIVRGQGGDIGTAVKVNGADTYYRTKFSGVKTIETYANATFTDVDFSGDNIDFNIKAATTTIKGTVEAKNAAIVLGSYDEQNYKANDATLDLPASTDVLKAESIAKYSGNGSGDVEAEVSNQGTVELEETTTTDVKWSGNGNDPRPDEGEEETPDYAGENGVYTMTDFSALVNDLNTKDFSKVKTVKISGVLVPSKEQYDALKKLFAQSEDDNVEFSGSLDLKNGDGTLSFNKLTVKTGTNYIGCSDGNKLKNMLTVKHIVVESGATLNVNQSRILVDQEVVAGGSDYMDIAGTLTCNYDGSVKAWKKGTNKGEYVTWDATDGNGWE